MNDKPLAKWTDKELAEGAQAYRLRDPRHGDTLAAEIDRRRAKRSLRDKLLGFVFAAIVALSAAAIVSLLVAIHLSR